MYTKDQDQLFMCEAIEQAKIAAQENEVPIGAIIVAPDGEIIARAHNKTEQLHSQIAHAEMSAITQAGKFLKNWRLQDCWIYITLEPCAMCMQAITLSRMAGVVYGAESPLFGYRLDKYKRSGIYQWPMPIKAGVCATQAAQILKDFFKKRREHGKGDRS